MAKSTAAVEMYNNSKTALNNIRWWKLLLLDLREKETMQQRLPITPERAITTWILEIKRLRQTE